MRGTYDRSIQIHAAGSLIGRLPRSLISGRELKRDCDRDDVDAHALASGAGVVLTRTRETSLALSRMRAVCRHDPRGKVSWIEIASRSAGRKRLAVGDGGREVELIDWITFAGAGFDSVAAAPGSR